MTFNASELFNERFIAMAYFSFPNVEERSTSKRKIAGSATTLPTHVLKRPWATKPHITPGGDRSEPVFGSGDSISV